MVTGVAVRAMRDEDRLPMAQVFADVAEERNGIGAEPPVDIEARAARFALEGSFVAIADGAIVGQISVQPSSHGYAEIGMLVAREWRGRGVGTALMEAGIAWARARGNIHKLSLSVFAHNAAGIALYKKVGFVEEGRRVKHYRRKNGEFWDSVEMGLWLGPE
jgi:putative acetyltransferase